jgi:hypothetical protein
MQRSATTMVDYDFLLSVCESCFAWWLRATRIWYENWNYREHVMEIEDAITDLIASTRASKSKKLGLIFIHIAMLTLLLVDSASAQVFIGFIWWRASAIWLSTSSAIKCFRTCRHVRTIKPDVPVIGNASYWMILHAYIGFFNRASITHMHREDSACVRYPSPVSKHTVSLTTIDSPIIKTRRLRAIRHGNWASTKEPHIEHERARTFPTDVDEMSTCSNNQFVMCRPKGGALFRWACSFIEGNWGCS